MAVRDHHGERRAVQTGLAISTVLCLAEAAGGWWTNSLALVSDAAHMLGDVAALSLTLFALWVGSRPASASKTFGYYRAEILAALVNGVVLWVVVVFILAEAWRRFWQPPEVAAGGMLGIAVVGLIVNLFVAMRLHGHAVHSLNLRGAYLHVVSDALGSVGALVAAVVILATGWQAADTLASVVIAALILKSSWALVRESVDVLMEAVPAHVDLERLQATLESVAGTVEVHDLHVWSLTTGHYALSAHAVIDGSVAGDEMLARMAAVCAREFHVDHVTIQLEQQSRRAEEPVH
ncbi:MAG TPA: cation diffusion facilitator family transporter [Candidatus Limnocylindria bacterium]|nr:cation diffusion facilitator family transporter [Candidatus Limnocylindria bacterium]